MIETARDGVLKAGQKVTFGEPIYSVNTEPHSEKSLIRDYWFHLMARDAVNRFYRNRKA